MELTTCERLPFTVANGIQCSGVVSVTTDHDSPTSTTGTVYQRCTNNRAVALTEDRISTREGSASSLASATSKGERSEPVFPVSSSASAKHEAIETASAPSEARRNQMASNASHQSAGEAKHMQTKCAVKLKLDGVGYISRQYSIHERSRTT